MERIVAPVIELIWRKVVASFTSKVVDQMADNALNNVQNIADFEPIFENLRKNLKSLSAKAADVEEEMTNLEVSGRKKRKREVEEWLEEVESIKQVVVELGSQVESEGFVMRLTEGGKAAQLNERVKELVEQSRNFGELVLNVRRTSGDTFLTDGMVGEAFHKTLETVLRILEIRKASSIGIYGMGGVGKTTLAQHIYNRLLQQSGACVFWVTVSQEFTITGLQDKIARLLGVKLSDEDEVGKRAMRLHRALSEKKNSVLILDDVWENIDMKKVGCLFSADGCRVIITTRSLEVCRRIGCRKEIPVEKLHEAEAWVLFKETLGSETELDLEVEGIAKSMVELCGGLPLGIIMVAGSMRGTRAGHRWRNAFLELQDRIKGKDGMGEDEVFKVLKFSFDQLKKTNDKSNEFNMRQLCFLHCSLYDEDCKIQREGLVRTFISHGLLDERKSRRARFDQGHSIIDELVDMCLLESCVDYGRKECVKMHDLVRSMALRICKGKYMVRAGEKSLKEIPNQEEWIEDLEKVSFVFSGINRIGEGLSPDCPKLSTLLLSRNYGLKVIPESFFCKMQGLCTLDLSWNHGITMLPNSVSDMTSLKSLLLEDCIRLEKVPYLGKMKALRELNLSHTAIKEAPQGLEELLKLEFLAMDANYLEMLPSGLLVKLMHLQQVSTPCHIKVPIAEIQNLKLLEFYGRLNCVEDINCLMRSGESHGEHLTWYTIIVGKEHTSQHYKLGDPISGEPYKKKLGLFECNLEDKRVFGQDTKCLIIRMCEGLSISFLNGFSGLRELEISKCGGIEWIMRSEDCQLSSTLEIIKLRELDDLKGVVGVMERERGGIGIVVVAAAQPPVFSSLKSLSITKCNKMRKLGLPAVSSLPNLEQLTIGWCGEVEEIFKEEDEGRAAGSTLHLPKLSWLTLSNMSRLKRVSNATIISNSIRHISIEKCPELINRMPLLFDCPTPPPSLRDVKVEREWWESLEWDTNINPNIPHLLHRFVEYL